MTRWVMQLLVRLRQWLASEPGGDTRVKVRASRDVAAGTAQPVADGLAGGLCPGDLLIEFRDLVLGDSPPGGRAGARRHEGLLLGDREPRVAVKQDGGDEPGRLFGVATLPGNPGRRGEQTDLLVIAQGRGRDTRAAGQFADGQQGVDFMRA
jgi:hypothetical protein